MPELKKYKMFIGGEWVDSDTTVSYTHLRAHETR